MSWGVRHSCEFTDLLALNWRVDIEKDGATFISYMQGAGNPLLIDYLSDSEDLYDSPVKGSKVDLTIYSDTDFEWIHLSAVEDQEYRMSVYYNDGTDVLVWRGFVIVNNYREPYDGISYQVTISASDGLGILKNIPYDNNGTYYNGRILESQIILDILSKIGYTEFTEFVNIYETRMNQTVNDSPMDQNPIDTDLFQDNNCYETLQEILIHYNAVIRYLNGDIIIYCPADLGNTTVYGRKFTGATAKTSVSFAPEQFVNRQTNPAQISDVEGGDLLIHSPAKKIDINQDYGYKKSWVNNWEFKSNTYLGAPIFKYADWTYSSSGIMPISQLIPGEKDGIALMSATTDWIYNVGQLFGTYAIPSSDVFSIEFDYLVYNQIASNTVKIVLVINSPTNSHYLYIDDDIQCLWDTSGDSINFIVTADTGSSGWINFKRSIPGIPEIGPYTIELWNPVASTTIFVGIKNIRFYATSDQIAMKAKARPKRPKFWKQPFGFLFNQSVFSDLKQSWDYLLHPNYRTIDDNPEVVEIVYNPPTTVTHGIDLSIGLTLGDVNDSGIDNVLEQFQGSLGVYEGATLTSSITWNKIGGEQNKPLREITGNEIQLQFCRSRQYLTLPIWESDSTSKIPGINLIGNFKDDLNKVGGLDRIFAFNKGSFNVRDRELSLDLVEVITRATVPPDAYRGYGALYNWYVVDTGLLAPVGWHVPTRQEAMDLILSIDPGATIHYYFAEVGWVSSIVAGGHLKAIGTTNWTTPNTGADNSSGFTGLGSGFRNADGTFQQIYQQFIIWLSEVNIYYPTTDGSQLLVGEYNSQNTANGGSPFALGESVRCVKNSTSLSIGQIGIVPDIDGNVYPTICMPDGKEWMGSNLKVEHYNDGSAIPEVTDNDEWAALTTGARCWYANISEEETASVDTSILTWVWDNVSTQIVTVTTNMAQWYFHSSSIWSGFTVTVYDSTNTTEITNGVYESGMVIRVTPQAENTGTANKNLQISIANANDLIIDSCTVNGSQHFHADPIANAQNTNNPIPPSGYTVIFPSLALAATPVCSSIPSVIQTIGTTYSFYVFAKAVYGLTTRIVDLISTDIILTLDGVKTTLETGVSLDHTTGHLCSGSLSGGSTWNDGDTGIVTFENAIISSTPAYTSC